VATFAPYALRHGRVEDDAGGARCLSSSCRPLPRSHSSCCWLTGLPFRRFQYGALPQQIVAGTACRVPVRATGDFPQKIVCRRQHLVTDFLARQLPACVLDLVSAVGQRRLPIITVCGEPAGHAGNGQARYAEQIVGRRAPRRRQDGRLTPSVATTLSQCR
jgi:hypothetical protein